MWPGRHEFQVNHFPSHMYLIVTWIKIQGKRVYLVVLNTIQQKNNIVLFLNTHLGSGAEGVNAQIYRWTR